MSRPGDPGREQASELGLSERDRQSSIRVAEAKIAVIRALDEIVGLTAAERDEALLDMALWGARRRRDAEIRRDQP